jgi:hypothetical protein
VVHLIKKRFGRRTYYYLAESRRVDGKVRTVWQKYLGTPETMKALLVGKEPTRVESLQFGVVALLHVARQLDLVGIVDRVLPKRG